MTQLSKPSAGDEECSAGESARKLSPEEVAKRCQWERCRNSVTCNDTGIFSEVGYFSLLVGLRVLVQSFGVSSQLVISDHYITQLLTSEYNDQTSLT